MPAPDRKRRLTAFGVAIALLIVTPLAVVAADRFTDVPNSNIFHDDINAIDSVGVTRGCNPPANTQYCPDDFVTREQMAAFMNRLGALGPGETPVANAATALEANHATEADHAEDAGTLNGFPAADLASRAAFAASGGLPDTNTTLSTAIEAPARGVVVMNATVDITNFTQDDTVICELIVDGAVVNGSTMFAAVNGTAGVEMDENICSTTGLSVVDPGSHDIVFNIRDVGTNTQLFDAFLTAMWVPFDEAGLTPASASTEGASDDK